MPRIPESLLNSVLFLYGSALEAEAGNQVGATGFLVGFDTDEGEYRRALVTNEHVLAGGVTFARVNTLDGGFEVLDLSGEQWVTHPDGDDIAAVPFPEPVPTWAVAEFSWTVTELTPERIEQWNMGVGDDVFMLGRYVRVDEGQRNQPLARFGNIAAMPLLYTADTEHPAVEVFLVEMRSLAGFSGSPVFVYFAPGTYRGNGTMVPFYSESLGLMGVDTGHIGWTTTVYDKHHGTAIDTDWIVRQNSGVAVVAPAWRIRQVLEALA